MLIPKVKICGITNYLDAKTASEMGADIIGFNFYPDSPRYITPEKALKIITMLPAFIDIAGVFVNSSAEQITKIVKDCTLNWVQLHGDETDDFCKSISNLNIRTMKAIRVKGPEDIRKAKEYHTDAILFDAFDSKQYGGTGKTFDWNIVGNIKKRIFLAGGINPKNAEDAVKLGIYGIDICSGIESAPGKKDLKLMKELFDNISHLRA